MAHTHQIQQTEALNFIIAGKATITIKSIKTDKHFTYMITVPKNTSKETANRLWVKLMTGCNNESDYKYIGFLRVQNNVVEFVHSGNGGIGAEALGVVSFGYIVNNLNAGRLINNLEIWHEGKCCRCGRKLTTPESVERGIGPECAGIKAAFEIKKQQSQYA